MSDIEVAQPKTLTRWDPFAEIEALAQNLRHGFPAWPNKLFAAIDGVDFTPLADVVETDTAWEIDVELPGIKKKDIEVESHGRTVVIHGERHKKEREGILRQRNRVTGSFRYEVTLPTDFDADAIKASLSDGELTVSVPKAEAQKPHKIKVN